MGELCVYVCTVMCGGREVHVHQCLSTMFYTQYVIVRSLSVSSLKAGLYYSMSICMLRVAPVKYTQDARV